MSLIQIKWIYIFIAYIVLKNKEVKRKKEKKRIKENRIAEAINVAHNRVKWCMAFQTWNLLS